MRTWCSPAGIGVADSTHEVLEAAPVVAVLELAVLGIEAPAADVRALGDDHALGALFRHLDLGGDGVRLVLDAQDAVLRQAPHAAEEDLGLALDQYRPAGGVGIHLLHHPVVDRQHLVARRLDQPQPLQIVELFRHLLGEILRLAPVLGRVVELPDIVVEGRGFRRSRSPGRPVLGHRGPALVVDAAVAEHLEVLRLVPLSRLGVVERVQHADTLDRVLMHAVHGDRLGNPAASRIVGATSMT